MTRFLLCAIAFIQSTLILFSQAEVHSEQHVSWGKFSVGHRHLMTMDSARVYDYNLGDTTLPINQNGRPILMNIYYPTKKSKGGEAIQIADLWAFTGNTQMDFFFRRFKDYEREMSKKYAIDENIEQRDFTGDTTTYLSTLNQLFEQYSSTNLHSKDGLEPLSQDLPVVIYHQGLGGTFDENIQLVELLASHGFLVITSSFVNSAGAWSLGVGDTDASIADIDFIIKYVQSNLSKNNHIFLMGHSFGANTIFNYPAVGKYKLSGIIPLDSDYGYSFYYHMPEKQKPNLEKQGNYIGLPIFAAGRSDAHFRMIDLLDQSHRTFLKIDDYKHNDFCAQTIIGARYCLPYTTQQKEIKFKLLQYQKLNDLILTFLNNCIKDNRNLFTKIPLDNYKMKLEIADPGERSAFNSKFETGKGNCPTNTQLLELIEHYGMQIAGTEWLNCQKPTDTSIFDFEWLNIYDALLHQKTISLAIQFLEFYIQQRPLNQNIEGFAFYTHENSFVDDGDGIHLSKADEVFHWMSQHIPNEIEGHKGLIMCKRVEEYYADEEQKARLKSELESLCTALLEQFPDYFNLPEDNDWDRTIKRIVKKNTP